ERLVARGGWLIASSVDLDTLQSSTGPVVDDAEPAATAAASTASTVEEAIATMWQELLGLPDISYDDDFFDMGGHSLIAIRLMARIHRQLGVRFQLATLFDAPTIAQLADLVREERPDIDAALAAASEAPTADAPAPQATEATAAAAPVTTASARSAVASCLVPIRREGTKEPFFVVHGAGGNVMFLSTLGRAMPDDRPVYGFQAQGVNEGEQMDPSLEAMATRYVEALRAFKPGPYLLGGYSGGGMV